MLGVVALLDEDHNKQVIQIWHVLEQQFSLRGIYRTPYPHFSYHIARRYDEERAIAEVRQLAMRTTPFTVQTTGLAVFDGERPVLHIGVQRNVHLAQLNEQLWTALASCGEGIDAYYRPEIWMPHITLAQHDIAPSQLASITSFLSTYDLMWDLLIDNLAIIANVDAPQQIYKHFALQVA